MNSAPQGIIAWFARNSVAANLLMWLIIIGGISSALTIQRSMFPDVKATRISVRVIYPGAAPQEVEQGIVVKIEEAVQQIQGIEHIVSTAWEGLAEVRLEIQAGVDILTVMDDVKSQLDTIDSFPVVAEKPIVSRQEITRDVIWVQVHGNADEQETKRLAQQVRDEIVALEGISRAEILGIRDYEITIELSEQSLREYGLSFTQVVDAIRQSSLDLPGGSIHTETGKLLLRTLGQGYYARDFAQLPILVRADGTRLLLGDIAQVIDGFKEEEGFARFNGSPSVAIQVVAVGEEDTLDIAAAVREYVANKKINLSSNYQLDTWGDSSYYLDGRLQLMLKNLFFGSLLVLIVLTLFLRLKVAAWVMVGIPIAFGGALWLMPLNPLQVDISMISLFGFILVLGIVVDDAIVIGESVFTAIREQGHSVDNVIKGAQAVALPATFGVLTTVVAFLPMLTVGGAYGSIWADIGIVVMLCLLFSLIESKLILPSHLANMRYSPHEPISRWGKFQQRCATGLENFAHKVYQPSLKLALKNRYISLAVFLGLLSLTIGVIASGTVKLAFFPSLASDFIRAELQMLDGTPSQTTERALKKITDALDRIERQLANTHEAEPVRHVLAYSISGTDAYVIAELSKSEERQISGEEIVTRWRDAVGQIVGAKSIKFNGSIGTAGRAALDFEFYGTDYEQVAQAAVELERALPSFAGVFDIENSYTSG